MEDMVDRVMTFEGEENGDLEDLEEKVKAFSLCDPVKLHEVTYKLSEKENRYICIAKYQLDTRALLGVSAEGVVQSC